ncbi:MAG TPA: hypothetical protein VMD79_15385 [Solirubrobacteraceae bacterium]|nr:hypothetical protein [Solirubrobacteraceae bacterium]
MVSSEVQRTLVKSPPELWAELSDAESLARHLRELGEVRIVRTEPESTVEWAAEEVTGSVSIKPSGWGTKVTLSARRQLSSAQAPAPAAAPAGAEVEPAPQTEPAPQAPEVETELDAASTPRRGFFARLFGRRRAKGTNRAEPQQSDAFAAVTQALAPETVATHHPFAAPEPPSDISAELASAELMAAEELAAEEIAVVLTAVLDRLGAAHHRPFSRA